jgi:hypothetical protein
MATVVPIGVYKVAVPKKEYEYALEVQADERYVKAELGSVVLIELRITGADERFDVMAFGQEGNLYVPWLEKYYSTDYSTLLADTYGKPKEADFILCFYLHFYDPAKPLRTPYGDVNPPPITDMPGRLSSWEYLYWD